MITYNKTPDPNKEFPLAKIPVKQPQYYLLRHTERINPNIPNVFLTVDYKATTFFSRAGLFNAEQLTHVPEELHDKYVVVPEQKIKEEYSLC